MDIQRFRISMASGTEQKVNEILNNGELALGPGILQFEKEIAFLAQNKFAVSTSNGFSALHLALEVLELRNKKIVMPAISSCMAIINAIKASGNEPYFIDSEDNSPNIDANKVDGIENVAAIISPNYFGVLSNITDLGKFGIPLIEDCAQSAGTQHYAKVSQPSELKVFSFYPTKIINAIDGGMICTNDPILKQKIISRRYYGGIKKEDNIQRFNYKMNNLNAVFGLAQLKQLDRICARRREIASRFINAIGSTKFLHHNPNQEVYQKFILKFDSEVERDKLLGSLNGKGIAASTELNPMTPAGDLKEFPCALNWWKTHISIPIYEDLSDKEVAYICDNLNQLLN